MITSAPKVTLYYPRCFVFIVGTALTALAGCASFNDRVDTLYQETTDGVHSMSAVQIREAKSGTILRSVVRMRGNNPQPIAWENLTQIHQESPKWGRIEFHSVQDIAADMQPFADSDLFDDAGFLPAMEAAIGFLIGDMAGIGARDLVLRVLVVPSDRAFVYIDDQEVLGGVLTITVGALSQGEYEHPLFWWLSLTEVSAHELAHINHGLLEKHKHGSSEAINREAAAEVIGGCAKIAFLEAFGDDNGLESIRLTFEDQGFLHAFPRLNEGEFSPEMKKLNVLGHFTDKGAVLGGAAIHSFTRNSHVYFNDVEMMNSLYSYCRHVANIIPRFDAGEMY